MRDSRAIALGTLVVGTLDALDALIFFGLRGAAPARIFQSIAAGLLGPAAYRGGVKTVLLGLATHYFIAFAVVTTYNLASRGIGVLTRHPVMCGAAYGIGVYVFMNRVVIPLSGLGAQRFAVAPFVNGIVIHVLGVGIPSALFAAAARRRSPTPVSQSRP
jgi:hypothetical protein